MAHYENPLEQNQPFKSREEQERDFQSISGWAEKGCPTCFGRGHSGWDTKNQLLIPCTCLLNNLNKEIQKERQDSAEQGGVLQSIANLFGRN